jgi:hypothetical protein
MTRPFRVARAEYQEVDWEPVRKLIIDRLSGFYYDAVALGYIQAMHHNAAEESYQISMRLAAAALLRVLKMHPASAVYNIVGAYRQLVQVATIEEVNFPGEQFLHELGTVVSMQLRNGGIPDIDLTTIYIPAVAGGGTDECDAPYRRIRRDLGSGPVDGGLGTGA